MTKKTQEFEKRNPDFAVGELYNFVLAYVTGPEILKHDDPKLIGIPFMFFIGDISDNYMGIKMEDVAARLKKKGIPYLSHSKFNDIFEDAHITFKAPPNIVYAGDKEFYASRLNRLLNHLSLSEPPKTPIDDQIRYYRYGGDPLF